MRYWTYFFDWYIVGQSQKFIHQPQVQPYGWDDPDWLNKESRLFKSSPIDAYFQVVPIGHKAFTDFPPAVTGIAKCGLFLDTSFTPWYRKPLVFSQNRQWVINNVLNWYDRYGLGASRSNWETVDGRPVILTYTNSFIGTPEQDDLLWGGLKTQFQKKFGVVPFLIVGDGWKGLHTPDGYTSYALGGATFTHAGPLLAAGPGNIYVGTRSTKALLTSLNVTKDFPHALAVLIQSWSEWKENSQIEPSQDEGTSYLDIVTKFKNGG